MIYIVICIEGGMLRDVYSDAKESDPHINITLVDYDNIEAGDPPPEPHIQAIIDQGSGIW